MKETVMRKLIVIAFYLFLGFTAPKEIYAQAQNTPPEGWACWGPGFTLNASTGESAMIRIHVNNNETCTFGRGAYWLSSMQVAEQARNGVVQIANNGRGFSYRANGDYVGEDVFRITVRRWRGNGTYAEGSILVFVNVRQGSQRISAPPLPSRRAECRPGDLAGEWTVTWNNNTTGRFLVTPVGENQVRITYEHRTRGETSEGSEAVVPARGCSVSASNGGPRTFTLRLLEDGSAEGLATAGRAGQRPLTGQPIRVSRPQELSAVPR